MDETDPYAAPRAEVSAPTIGSEQFRDLDGKQLKKLYYPSSAPLNYLAPTGSPTLR